MILNDMNDLKIIYFFDELPELEISEVFEAIDLASKNLRRIQRQTVSETGLTPPQYQVLRILWQRDERPFKELAEECVCTRATITGIVDNLERKGLVKREPNPADRRSLLATLTAEGRELQHKTPSLGKVYAGCCSGLTPVEFQQVGFLLNKLNDSLKC